MAVNLTNPGPTLAQRLNPSIAVAQAIIATVMRTLRVAVPGVVQAPPDGSRPAFDPGPPATVCVTIAVNEYVERSSQSGPINITTKSQPIYLQDVPVVMPTGGGWSMTFPIKEGDECWVVFSDLALDSWFQSGGIKNTPVNPRRHDLSDGVAIFGVRSAPNGLTNYSTTSCQIRNDDGSVVIDLTNEKVTVTAPTIDLECSGDVTVNCAGAVVTCSADATVNAKNATLQCTDDAKVEADTVEITGNSSVTISGDNATKIEGKTFLLHTHTGVTTGGGKTGPVF